jgi:hypothetical protein
MKYRGRKAIRLSGLAAYFAADFAGHMGHFLPGKVSPGLPGRATGKKIEQDTSPKCLKSEYLTLLNSFRVLQTSHYTATGPAAGAVLYRSPPKSFNEKELYGR